ncbi:MAG: dehydratase [Ardenticatenaceae bacterium]|nr:dehydratase [Ardenticatenaceae bacterium]MCB9444584.1 dehydratase [Ardenticatenaceae bacterium]
MTELTYQPRGLYFEDFEIGQKVVTAGRTVTEADIVTFSGLSGDFNQIHTDAAYSANYDFGQRIAHGLLVQSIATGLAVRTGVIEGTVLAFRELSAKFSLPTFIGNTVHVVIEITEKKALPRLGGGNVTMKYSVLNQDDKVVQRGDWIMLVKSKS